MALVFSIFIKGLYDANLKVIIPAIISGIALAVTHIKKEHLDFNKYFIATIFASFFFAMELVVSRLILNFYSPISFYFIRCLAVFGLSFLLFKPKLKGLPKGVGWKIFVTGAVWVVFRVVTYYGYLKIGVIFTTLILMLAPIFTYTAAKIFLKEKLTWRNIIASLVIVGSVVYALLG